MEREVSRALKHQSARSWAHADFQSLRILAFVVPMLMLVAAGCGGKSDATHAGMPPVPVRVATAVAKTVPEQLKNIGTVEAFSTVNIKARVEGQLIAIDFKEGDFVKKGQLLFTLDPRPLEAALAQAKATHNKDLASAHQAQLDERRYKLLLDNGVGSQQQYDQAYGLSHSLTAAAAADLAAIRNAEISLEYTQIRSPIDGRTGGLQVHIGDMIKPDSDTPMVVINQIEPIYVDFSIPERNLAEVRRYMEQHPLEVQAQAPGQQNLEEGVLSFIDNTVNTTTGTIMLKGLFKNEDRRLWPGQFVNATLILRQIPNAVLVPSEALETGQSGAFVYVVGHDMKVEARPVVAGAQIDANTIIERGITKGETVVTDGQLRLAPGAMVRIKTSLGPDTGKTS